MNIRLATLLCLLLIAFCTGALSEATPFDFNDDAWSTAVAEGGESIEIEINGQSTSLAFDNSTEYSSVSDGTVQASFYAYSENSDYLYELYMIFPDSVESGSTITPEYALTNNRDCSVVLIISDKDREQYYFAGQVDGKVFPSESSYTMTFDSVADSASACTYTGRLSASLGETDLNEGEPLASFRIENAPFSFTMPMEAPTQAPAAPDGFPEDFPDELPDDFDDSIFDAPTPAPDVFRV